MCRRREEPIDFTKQADALLTNNPEKSRTYWFLYDRIVQVAAMGIQAEGTGSEIARKRHTMPCRTFA